MPGIRPFKLVTAAFVLLAAAAGAQSTPAPSSSPPLTDHVNDSYAIYSALVAGQQARIGQPLAIAGTTLDADDIGTDPDHDVQPSPDIAIAFHDAVQDFHAHREQRVQLQRQLKLDRPYTLLTEDEVTRSKNNPGASGITLFSEVYFNPSHTAALVYMDHVCASPCGSGQWIFLEKQDDQWVRRSNSTFDPADTYAIYSLLLRDDPYPGLPQQQGPVAIAETTVNITDMNPAVPPDGQLQAPGYNPDAFREAVEDFRTRRYERLQLKRNFHLNADYVLLNPGQVAAYKQAQTGYPAVNFFSEVYFNAKQTAALVYRNVFCGHLCANGQWIYLEKQGKQWVRRSGLNI
jgi:hypothetical protein